MKRVAQQDFTVQMSTWSPDCNQLVLIWIVTASDDWLLWLVLELAFRMWQLNSRPHLNSYLPSLSIVIALGQQAIYRQQEVISTANTINSAGSVSTQLAIMQASQLHNVKLIQRLQEVTTQQAQQLNKITAGSVSTQYSQ